MLLLSEYTILERISHNGNTLLYRAERCADRQKVILKMAENALAGTEEAARIIREYDLVSRLSFKGIARFLKLSTYNQQTISVMADFEGIPLEEYLQDYKINIVDTLKIAIGITEILEYLYQQGIVHQNLCPAHLFVHPQTLEVTLVDCALASPVSPLSRTVEQPALLKGALTYIAPEQTGRIRGEIDNRSDLYSLGVILYELVTGRPPFETTEALSLIHCHIAKNPVPPHFSNPYLPIAFSRVILKLLSKNAEDRYQSPFGLKIDLLTCLQQRGGGQKEFVPGQHDFSGRLKNPKRFYGREKEIKVLQGAFEQAARGTVQMVMVEGFSGIGKSALVYQVKDTVRRQGGIFVNGKFNQYQRNIPYFAFIKAFKEFTDLVLTQSDEEIQGWKEQILKAVGGNGRVLTDIIPHLELLIGPQPPVPELESNETWNRFHYVFLNFIRTIARREHPLVIFFDDLQWSDAASMHLLKIIAADKDLESLLFVGAYRDNEKAANAVFADTIEDMEKWECCVQQILLTPLPRRNVEEIISEMLGGMVQDSSALVKLVCDKSQGNPFFINAFLKCLHAEEILVFDFVAFQWTWDAARVQQLRVSENIVELMTGRIQKLPRYTQALLKAAACLGYHFDVQLLGLVLELTREEIADRLKPALDEDLILPSGDNYSFTHDRIQQAAYCLIPDGEKKDEHLKIGRSLLLHLDAEARNNYIFEIVNQLNAGLESIGDQEEKDRLAALNLTAGVKAKNSAAYRPSFEYLQTGISLLHAEAWSAQYELALQLYTEGAESGFLSGHNDRMEAWIEVVLQHAQGVLDKVRVYEIRIKFFITQHKLLEALQIALQVLELLDVRFPKNPTKAHVLTALLQIRLALLRKPPESLMDLPLIQNPYVEAAIRVMVSVGSAVYFARPTLLPILKCKLFYLMIRHGNSAYSGVICNAYALILIAGLGDLNGGHRFGRLAMQLSEKFEVGSLKCQTRMMSNTFVIHWKEHIRNTLEPLQNNYLYGLENGNIEFATYSALVYCHNAFFTGQNLKELAEEVIRYYDRFQNLKHESALNLHCISAQTVLNLYEQVERPTILTGRLHDEEKMIGVYKANRGETGLYKIYLYKLILAYLFDAYDEAQQYAQEARSRIKSVAGSPEGMIFYFYDTLTRLAVVTATEGLARKAHLQKIRSNLAVFKKLARAAPMNGSQKLLLMTAEYSRVRGRLDEAALLYDRAMEDARKNEYLNDLALAAELAGRFYKAQHRDYIAQHYLLLSYRFYQQWGAVTKVKDMEKRYAYIFDAQQLKSTLNTHTLNSVQTVAAVPDFPAERSLHHLDLHSIMKAATAISGEVQLDRLLKKLVKIAVENAGAQQGYLILKKDAGFFIEAEGSVDAEEEVVVQSVPLKGNASVPEAIVQYVYVTKENLVIDNALEHPNFAEDPIIQRNRSKSILCTPIIHQCDVIGMLYFENDLITDAFTQERIELLQLLSGQMAISLQNALNEQKKMNALMEREKLVQKINTHQQELLKTRLEIQEQTFHNISGEIHDNIGQALTLIKLNINTIDLADGERAKEKLLESKSLLTKVIQDLRDLAKTFNTDFIEKIGLANAIDQQLQFLKKTGLYATQLSVSGEPVKFEAQRELVLFRVVQELVNNVVKHAEANTISIAMVYRADRLVITVSDNGKGFDSEKLELHSNKSLGMHNIYNRMKLIKGFVFFESALNQGTTATIELQK